MLTVKVISPSGVEVIHCGPGVGFNPSKQIITVSGMDQEIMLKNGEIAYVMNANGKTISRYEHTVSTFYMLKVEGRGRGSGENIWEVPSELGRPI